MEDTTMVTTGEPGTGDPGSQPTFSGGAAPIALYTAETVMMIDPGASLLEAARELQRDEVGLLVVGTGSDVSGVLSERDVVHAVAAARDPDQTTVADIASPRIVWCDIDATVHEVADMMMEHYVRHVLVESDGQLRGVVSARDLLGAYTTADTSYG